MKGVVVFDDPRLLLVMLGQGSNFNHSDHHLGLIELHTVYELKACLFDVEIVFFLVNG